MSAKHKLWILENVLDGKMMDPQEYPGRYKLCPYNPEIAATKIPHSEISSDRVFIIEHGLYCVPCTEHLFWYTNHFREVEVEL